MIYLLVPGFLIAGTVFILSGVKLPAQKEKRLLKSLTGPPEKQDFEGRFIIPVAAKFERYVRLPDDKRKKLDTELKNNGYAMTPELYTARNLTVSALFLFVSAIMFLFHRPITILLGIIYLILTIAAYSMLSREVGKEAGKKRTAIQAELPQFMLTLIETLKYDRNIAATADKYRLVAGPQLRRELDRLVLDMKTVNQEQALLGFADRIGIDTLTSFVTGLVSESRGINQEEYLLSVENSLRQTMKENLKKEALKKPDKMRIAQFALVASAVLVWIAALGYQIVYSIMYTTHM